MRIAMLATASAVAFVFAIGSVSAADQFKTLKGVKAVQMTAGELSSVKGMDHHFQVNTPGQGLIDPNNSPNAKPFSVSGTGASRFGTDWHNEETNSVPGGSGDGTVAPSYQGFGHASCNTVIVVPGFATCL